MGDIISGVLTWIAANPVEAVSAVTVILGACGVDLVKGVKKNSISPYRSKLLGAAMAVLNVLKKADER
jgi:hypothetical protein